MSLRKYLLKENTARDFDNWVVPDDDKLKLEFKVEHEIKGRNFFDSFNEFNSAVNSAKQEVITKSKDEKN